MDINKTFNINIIVHNTIIYNKLNIIIQDYHIKMCHYYLFAHIAFISDQ